MNKIERIKRERDGLDVREMIAHYAETGWEAISEDEIQRLKWHGLFLRNPTPGFFTDDLQNIAALAERYGTGEIRLSPAQSLIIPNVVDRKVGALCEERLVSQFAYNPSPLYKGLVSCVGNAIATWL